MRSTLAAIILAGMSVQPTYAADDKNTSGLGVSLTSVVEVNDRFIAVLEFDNTTDRNIDLALVSKRSFQAEAYLRGNAGGDCQAIANGEAWGSLPSNRASPYFTGDPYAQVPAHSKTQETIFFHKSRCEVKMDSGETASLDAVILKKESGKTENLRISFRSIAVRVK